MTAVLRKRRPVNSSPVPRRSRTFPWTSTHAALRPVNVEEGEGEQGLVPLLGQQLLLELHEVRLQVNHPRSPAVRPATVLKSH